MKKKLISILITNHNKNKFLKKNLKKCLNQTYKNYEIILYDDRSNDGSINTVKKFKNIKIIENKKNYKSSPLNQLRGIMKAFKKSKGKLVCFLDADDYFFKNKLKLINNFFEKHKNKNILFDLPISKEKKIQIKKKNHEYSIWPTIIPTSGISVRKNTLKKFFLLSKYNSYPHLEIDSRIMIFSFHYLQEMSILNQKLTYYNFDLSGISSNYPKYSTLWWKKRYQAFEYLKFILKKKNKEFINSFDYRITKIINMFLK